MIINCNVTGRERKRLVDILGAMLLMEPIYKKAPTFAYVVSDYTIDKNGTIFCPVSASTDDVAKIVATLTEEGFSPEIGGSQSADADNPAECPTEAPDAAPEAKPEDIPEEAEVAADTGIETPETAAPEEDAAGKAGAQPDENQAGDDIAKADNTKLTVSIPRAKLADDALARLRTIVANKEVLFKRALLTDALPIEVTAEQVSFPWFKLTGMDGEAEAYTQFITALCQMATEQKRVLDKPYDSDNDRFTMRIFMVRLNMKGAQFALARKLMMKHLTGNSGWRYEDSVSKPERSSPIRSAIQHLKKAYPNDTRVELIPLNDETSADIQLGTHGTIIGVDDHGSVFVRLDNGSAFGIKFSTEQTDSEAKPKDETVLADPEEYADEEQRLSE